MAARFFDLDGTVLRYHTNEFLPGVVDALVAYADAGDQIIFITMRGPQDDNTEWSLLNTYTALENLPFGWKFMPMVQSPRFLVDDGQCGAINAITDHPESWIQGPWTICRTKAVTA